LRKYLKFILLFLFTAFLLWFFVRNLNWQEVIQSLRRANPWYLGVGAAIISFGYLLRSIRWKVLLEPLTQSSLKELFATTTVGFAAIFVVGRAGEIVRPMWLPMRDRRVRPSAALVTLGLERIFDLAALACFFAVNLLWFDPPPGRETEFEYLETVGYVMLGAVILGFLALYIYQRISDRVIDWAGRVLNRSFIPRRIRRIILSILEKLSGALQVLKDWREMLLIAFWSFALWLAIAIPTWLVLVAFDLPFSFSDSIVIMGIAAVASVIPTPGGAAGAFHTATAASLMFLKKDLSTDDAAAVSIAMHLVYFAPALFFGLYYFLHGDISIERFRSLLSSEHAVEEIESEAPNNNGQLKVESGK
jgi:glycosyltransferase 2 family protein